MFYNTAHGVWKAGPLLLTLLMMVLLFWTKITSASDPPGYKTLPPASSEELTRSDSALDNSYFETWPRSHGNAMSNRYSSLAQINRSNVSELEVAWTYNSEYSDIIQANPIFVDGKLIFPIPGSYLVALDGATGKELWRFQTQGKPAIRGLVWWPGNDSTDSRLFFAAGYKLHALSLDGKPVPEFGQDGAVTRASYSLAAPAIAKDTIIFPLIGDAAVEGIDVVTGEVRWTTPLLEPLPDSELSDPDTYAGANPWSGISVDEERGLAYISTGNPKPDFGGVTRPGDNRNANSLVAIDISNGNIVWSFQEIAHDLWDKDIPAPPVLTQIVRDGDLVDVVAAVTKHGNTILLDRVTGKLVYPWRMRRAPASELVGEQAAEYQPDVELPEPFSKQVFGVDDLTDLGSENFEFAKNVFDQANSGFFPAFADGKDTIYFGLRGGAEWGGGVADPFTHILYVASNDVPWRIQVLNVAGLDQVDFPDTPRRKSYIEHCSACHGAGLQGSGPHPALYGIEQRRPESFIRQIVSEGRRGMPKFGRLPPDTIDDLVAYIQSVKPEMDQQVQEAQTELRPEYQYTGWRIFRDSQGYPANKPPWGWLNALDLNTGRMAWKVPLGKDKLLEQRGFGTVGTENLGGPVVTSGGLVFVAGTTDKLVRAFDKETGQELWSHELPFVGSAPPTVYMAGGRQYLFVPATGGLLETPVGNHFVAFALPAFEINPGLNDAWYNPATNGQGFLVTVLPEVRQMFLAWFTYDAERPPEETNAILGEPGHRWLTAQGPYNGDTAELTVYVTEGGVFDAAQPAAVTDQSGDGTLKLEFADCTEGLVSYEITSLGVSGEIPIQRTVPDNVPLCESFQQ
jgi:quinoprotein glucose dehydrogenase